MLAERGLRRNGPFGPTLQVAGRLFAECGGVRAPVRFRAVDRSEVALQRPVVQFAPGVPQELWDADWASVRECHPNQACRRGRLRAKDAQPGGALPLRLVQRILRCFDQGEPDRGPSQSRRLTDTDAQGRTTRLFAEKLSDALDLSNDLARIVFEKAQGKLVTADSRADLIGSPPLADDAAEVSEQPISLVPYRSLSRWRSSTSKRTRESRSCCAERLGSDSKNSLASASPVRRSTSEW